MDPKLRERLEWSWDYAIAETCNGSTKEMARAISAGIRSAAGEPAEYLVNQFLIDRSTGADVPLSEMSIDPEWDLSEEFPNWREEFEKYPAAIKVAREFFREQSESESEPKED